MLTPLFFRLHSTTQILTMHTHSLQRTHTQTVLYKYLRRLSQQIIEIDKVIVGARA